MALKILAAIEKKEMPSVHGSFVQALFEHFCVRILLAQCWLILHLLFCMLQFLAVGTILKGLSKDKWVANANVPATLLLLAISKTPSDAKYTSSEIALPRVCTLGQI